MAKHTMTVQTDSSRTIVDVTDRVNQALEKTGVGSGLACISVPHCTCAVYVNENESGLVQDTLDLLKQLTDGQWQHNRIDNNADAHLAASVVGNSVLLPIEGGRLELGTWQRLMLIELDGPRSRRMTLTVLSDDAQE